MNWKAKVVAFAKQVGPACKFVAKTVLGTVVPGSPAVIDLVEKVLDAATETADDVWEVERDRQAVADLERVSNLLELMSTSLGTALAQIAALEGMPDAARRILDVALLTDMRVRDAGKQLKELTAGFDRLEIQFEQFAGRQEMSLDLQQEMLTWQRLSIGLMLTMYGENVTDPRRRERFRRALSALGEGRLQEAHPALISLVQELPESAAVHGALGVVEAVEQDLPAAQATLARAAQLNPAEPALQQLSSRATAALTRRTPAHPITDARLHIGDKLGGWEVIQLLGSGGWGQVVKARKADQVAALKVLHAKLSRDEAFQATFRKEMMALMQLKGTPHLAEILDFGFCQEHRRWFFVMAFVEGMSLQTYLERNGPLTLDMALASFRPVAEAVGHAHGRGIVHRDIKPANLLRDFGGVVTLVDFGLAGIAEARGTLEFAAPEQLRGRPADARSDVYSLAAAFYFAITGEHPDHFQPARIDNPIISKLLSRSLATNSQLRPRNAAEFAAHLIIGPQTLVVPGRYRTIQAALNAAHPGDTVLVRPGEYRESLSLPEGVTLCGEDRDQCRVLSVPEGACSLKTDGLLSGVIENLTFDGTGCESAASRDGLVIENSILTVNNCALIGWSRSGVRVNGAKSEATLRNNFCRFNGMWGIAFTMGARGTAEKNLCEENKGVGIMVLGLGTTPALQKNQCQRNEIGIAFGNGACGTAEGNYCAANRSIGIFAFDHDTNPLLRSNNCKRNQSHGLCFAAGARGVADANACEGNEDSGIAVVNRETAPVLRNNQCRGNLKHGFCFKEGASGTAEQNTAQDNQGSGIVVLDRHSAPSLRNNQCSHNRQSGLVVGEGTIATAESNSFEENGKCGIEVTGPETMPVLRKNQCSRNAMYGIFCSRSVEGTIEGNICVQNDWSGIMVIGPWTCPAVRNNQCCLNGMHGLSFGAGADGIVESNLSEKNQSCGIAVVDTGTSPTLRRNTCLRNAHHGVYFGKGSNAEAEGNICHENTWAGIAVNGDGTHAELRDNCCEKNDNWGIICWDKATWSGTGNQASGNAMGQIKEP